MYIKCLLLLFVAAQIEAQLRSMSQRRSVGLRSSCRMPTFEHGKIRKMQRGNLIKFSCFPGYQLAGNKYATCSHSEWDIPIPVCVKPGCPLPKIKDAIMFTRHQGAWIEVFCAPDKEMVGHAALFCDGKQWNGTAPSCVETTARSSLSCDFEDPDICGWIQDELHDFDWKRLNGKTPSSFLFTGPSKDHTVGKNGSGYYMYIESTSKLENDTARLISPIYKGSLANNGCFSFFYHMFGLTTGGLRVYQKPVTITMETILALPAASKQNYMLFEKWGNQGDYWYRSVSQLNQSFENFQIIIEGIRGTSFTSDIAIDDVAILQGENCTIAKTDFSTPATVMPDSCYGRCDIAGVPSRELGCGCTASCILDRDCCPDFFDCLLAESTNTESSSDPGELPQTQKLVASTTSKIPVSTTTKMPTTTPTLVTPTTKNMSTMSTLETPIIPPSTRKMTTTIPTTRKTTTMIPTFRLPKTPIPALNMTASTTTRRTDNITVTTKRPIPTLVYKYRTTISNGTGRLYTIKNRTITVTTKRIAATTAVPIRTKTAAAFDDKMKAKKEQSLEHTPLVKEKPKSNSSSVKIGLITSAALLCCLAGAVWLIISARSVRGRIALARLRGHTNRDTEVRYLNADVDDDDD